MHLIFAKLHNMWAPTIVSLPRTLTFQFIDKTWAFESENELDNYLSCSLYSLLSNRIVFSFYMVNNFPFEHALVLIILTKHISAFAPHFFLIT